MNDNNINTNNGEISSGVEYINEYIRDTYELDIADKDCFNKKRASIAEYCDANIASAAKKVDNSQVEYNKYAAMSKDEYRQYFINYYQRKCDEFQKDERNIRHQEEILRYHKIKADIEDIKDLPETFKNKIIEDIVSTYGEQPKSLFEDNYYYNRLTIFQNMTDYSYSVFKDKHLKDLQNQIDESIRSMQYYENYKIAELEKINNIEEIYKIVNR